MVRAGATDAFITLLFCGIGPLIYLVDQGALAEVYQFWVVRAWFCFYR